MPLGGASTNDEEEDKVSRNSSSMQINHASLNLFSQTSAPFPGMYAAPMNDEPPLCSTDALPSPKSPEHSEETPRTFQEQDILLGRGAQYSQNPGNRRFYEAIDNSIPRYDAAQTKHEKSGVVLSIFQLLSSENCRFLKKNEEDGSFSQIEDKDARQKISHALRYRKQNRSEPSLMSAAAKKASSDSRNAVIPRVHSACATSESQTKRAKKNAKTIGHEAAVPPSIFSDEELDSVAPHGNDFPSSFASFQYYSEQDDELADNTSPQCDEGDCFPW